MDLETNTHGRKKKRSHLDVTKPDLCQEKVSKRNEKLLCHQQKITRERPSKFRYGAKRASLNLTLPPNVQTLRFRLSIPVVREK